MSTETALAQQTATVMEIIQSVPKALELNQTSVSKAKAAAQVILDTIEAEGFSPQLYEAAQDTLKKITVTYTKCYERRAPFFREVDKFREQFTSLEKQIDPKVKDSCAAILQKKLDEHVAELAKQEQERAAAAKRKLAMDQEAISLKNDLDAMLVQHVNGYIADAKKYFTGIFETITLETIEKDKAVIAAQAKAYPQEHLDSFCPKVAAVYHDKDQVTALIESVKAGKHGGFTAMVTSALRNFKAELLDKVPGKKNELEAAAKAKAEKEAADKAALEAKTAQAKADALLAQAKAEEEQKRLTEATALRQKQEQERQAKEQADADLKASQAAESAKAAQQTQTLFDHQVNSMAATSEAPPAKEGYAITISNPAGYLPIVAFYFEKEGMKKLPEELEKKTLKQMVTFAEKWALKNENEKVTSPYIIYKPTYKAVGKKS